MIRELELTSTNLQGRRRLKVDHHWSMSNEAWVHNKPPQKPTGEEAGELPDEKIPERAWEIPALAHTLYCTSLTSSCPLCGLWH